MQYFVLVLLLFCANCLAEGSAYNRKCDIDSVRDMNNGDIVVTFDTYGCENVGNPDERTYYTVRIVSEDSGSSTLMQSEYLLNNLNNHEYTFTSLYNGNYKIQMFIYQEGDTVPTIGDTDYFTITKNGLQSFKP